MRYSLHSTLFRHLRGVTDGYGAGALPDGQLLERFLTRRDEAAFEVLLWRHGALVWSVCRRLLHDLQAAEDAFQATFLTFVRKAGSIGKRESVGSWLYKVAFRTALAARARERRSECVQVQDLHLLPAEPNTEAAWHDVREILDEEVSGLPGKYRAAFILCYLQGRTNAQAARELGCCEGTVVSRLAWARRRLRQRLAGRGLAVGAGLLTTLLTKQASATAMAGAVLVASTLDAAWRFAAGVVPLSSSAALLAEGVLRSMLLRRLQRLAVTIVILCLVSIGGGLSLRRALAGKTTQAPGDNSPPARAKDASADRAEMQGTWEMWQTVQESINGQPQPPRKKKATIVIAGDKLSELGEDGFMDWQWTFKLHPTRQPKWIDLTSPVFGAFPGIYRLEGDSLKIHFDKTRPTQFPDTSEGWANLKRVSRTPAEAAERFASAPGCFWMTQPTTPSITMATLGMVYMYEKDHDGAAVITLAYAGPDPRTSPARRYRPVLLDAAGKRYLPGAAGGGFSEGVNGRGVHLYRWRMDPAVLPAARVARLGIEAETEEADRIDAIRAQAEARVAGIDVLPWPTVGKPYAFDLTTLDGRKLRSRDLAGKVVVIDCWACWCSPCMQKCLELKPLYAKWHEQGLEIVGISLDHSEAAVRKACESNGFVWPQVLVPTAQETRSLWERASGIGGIPRLFVIDRKGILHADNPEKVDQTIARLMEKSGRSP